MCLAIPMQLVDRQELEGTVELGGVRRAVSLALCPEAGLGEFLLIHAGYAIGVVDEEEARETLKLITEVIDATEATL